MRYHIDTIPVWDAAKIDGECLLCALNRKNELSEAERYLGASVMEPDTRIQVNDKGFCPKHHSMLYGMSNRLGHALMLESHTAETRKRMASAMKQVQEAAGQVASLSMTDKLTGKGQKAKQAYEDKVQALTAMTQSCIMCDSIKENMERYLHTFFHLYQNDTEFRTRLLASKGLCLPHVADLLRIAPQELKGKALEEFVSAIVQLETPQMDRIQEEISWFIKKFDYRFEKEPWKNSKDAVERTVNKLRGWCVGQEPNPKET